MRLGVIITVSLLMGKLGLENRILWYELWLLPRGGGEGSRVGKPKLDTNKLQLNRWDMERSMV